jgi:hypothetical protein
VVGTGATQAAAMHQNNNFTSNHSSRKDRLVFTARNPNRSIKCRDFGDIGVKNYLRAWGEVV